MKTNTETILNLKIQPKSSKNEVVGLLDNKVLKIRLQAPPVKGAANKALMELLSEALSIKKTEIEILTGQTGRQKLVKIFGLSEVEIFRRLKIEV